VEDFWTFYNNLRTVAFDMFFLMREGHPPSWEHESNIRGGGLSFRVPNKDIDNMWLITSMLLIGETICQCPEEVVGLSVSPKSKNTTIRVWYRNQDRLRDIEHSLHKDLLTISSDYLVRCHADTVTVHTGATTPTTSPSVKTTTPTVYPKDKRGTPKRNNQEDQHKRGTGNPTDIRGGSNGNQHKPGAYHAGHTHPGMRGAGQTRFGRPAKPDGNK
jgi:hypothetical protein